MIHSLLFTDKAIRQLRTLDRKAQERIKAALDRVRTRPYDYAVKTPGELEYKMRIGDCKIIMSFDTNKLIIMLIKGHRRNIYGRQ